MPKAAPVGQPYQGCPLIWNTELQSSGRQMNEQHSLAELQTSNIGNGIRRNIVVMCYKQIKQPDLSELRKNGP